MSDRISPSELEALLASDAVTLLDVRRAGDRAAAPAGIAGATWKAPEEAAAWAGELPPGKPVVIYCVRGGSVSTSVHAALKERGIDVRFLDGGLAAWEARGARS